MVTYSIRTSCGLCGSSKLTQVLKLNDSPIANRLRKTPIDESLLKSELVPLTLIICETCFHVQIRELVDPKILFSDYPYMSSTSQKMRERLLDLSNLIDGENKSHHSMKVVEIGSNDGYLLGQLMKKGWEVLGIDPAISAADEADKSGVPNIRSFFDQRIIHSILDRLGKPDVIIANNVLAHTNNLHEIFTAIKKIMKNNTKIYMECSYFLDVYEKTLIDTIYHEHTCYHTIHPLIKFLEKFELEIIRVDRFNAHGGSVRLVIGKKLVNEVDIIGLNKLLEEETEAGLADFNPDKWRKFIQKVSELSTKVSTILRDELQKGRKIVGYGISAKFSTLYFGLKLNDYKLDYCIDDNEFKIGKFAPGTNYLINSLDAIRDMDNITFLVFSWNYQKEIAEEIFSKFESTSVVAPLPNLTIYNSVEDLHKI